MEDKSVNARRCIICQKADYGDNIGLEKVDRCQRCESLVCVRCKGRCCEIKEEVSAHYRAEGKT